MNGSRRQLTTRAVARFYDELWTRYRPRRDASRRHLELLLTDGEIRGRTVLDAGCGSGVFCGIFAEKRAEHVIGVDISRGSLAAARRRLGAHAPRPATLAEADMLRLPFRDGRFDIVWCWGAVHHTVSPPDAIRELARVTKPGGTLLITHYKRTRLSPAHDAIRRCLSAAPRRTWHGISKSLAALSAALIPAFQRRAKLRQGESLSELVLDWCFTPVRHYDEPSAIAALLESEHFAVECVVPACGRFDSTSNFIVKAQCQRNGR